MMEDGSGGYNGGGSGLKRGGYYGFAGGGATDIRYGGSKVTQDGDDYRILVAGGGGGADNLGGVKNGSDDGSGGCGGGTISNSKESWSGTEGLINGKSIEYSLIKGIGSVDFNLYYYNEITQNEDGEDKILITPCAGGWNSDDTAKGALINVETRKVMKFFGQNSTLRGAVGGTFYDHAGGGAGYYGGECSNHNNGGASGGSAYADIEGKIKLVTNVKGYCGYENGNGLEMLGKYGNGKIVISK